MPRCRSLPAQVRQRFRSPSRLTAASLRYAPRIASHSHLLRGPLRKRGGPTRGRSGGAQPRASPSVAEQRVRCRLPGPMRPGGGCQFTFTCDGSLGYRPQGENWARAQLLASERWPGGCSSRSACPPSTMPTTCCRPGHRAAEDCGDRRAPLLPLARRQRQPGAFSARYAELSRSRGPTRSCFRAAVWRPSRLVIPTPRSQPLWSAAGLGAGA
jgi:hypothetical protein